MEDAYVKGMAAVLSWASVWDESGSRVRGCCGFGVQLPLGEPGRLSLCDVPRSSASVLENGEQVRHRPQRSRARLPTCLASPRHLHPRARPGRGSGEASCRSEHRRKQALYWLGHPRNSALRVCLPEGRRNSRYAAGHQRSASRRERPNYRLNVVSGGRGREASALLGKLMLYQLSYTRGWLNHTEPRARSLGAEPGGSRPFCVERVGELS